MTTTTPTATANIDVADTPMLRLPAPADHNIDAANTSAVLMSRTDALTWLQQLLNIDLPLPGADQPQTTGRTRTGLHHPTCNTARDSRHTTTTTATLADLNPDDTHDRCWDKLVDGISNQYADIIHTTLKLAQLQTHIRQLHTNLADSHTDLPHLARTAAQVRRLRQLQRTRHQGHTWPNHPPTTAALNGLLDHLHNQVDTLINRHRHRWPQRIHDHYLLPTKPGPPPADLRPFGDQWQQALQAIHHTWRHNASRWGRHTATWTVLNHISGRQPLDRVRPGSRSPARPWQPQGDNLQQQAAAALQLIDTWANTADQRQADPRPDQLVIVLQQPDAHSHLLVDLWPSHLIQLNNETFGLATVPAAVAEYLTSHGKAADRASKIGWPRNLQVAGDAPQGCSHLWLQVAVNQFTDRVHHHLADLDTPLRWHTNDTVAAHRHVVNTHLKEVATIATNACRT